MALVTLPSNNNAVEVIAAAGKGVIQVQSGTALLENAADPSAGIVLTQGEAITVDGWTTAWFGESGVVGKACVLKVATE